MGPEVTRAPVVELYDITVIPGPTPIPLIIEPTTADPIKVAVFKFTIVLMVADKLVPDPSVKTYSPSP